MKYNIWYIVLALQIFLTFTKYYILLVIYYLFIFAYNFDKTL